MWSGGGKGRNEVSRNFKVKYNEFQNVDISNWSYIHCYLKVTNRTENSLKNTVLNFFQSVHSVWGVGGGEGSRNFGQEEGI